MQFAVERLDADNERINIIEKNNHLQRYYFASDYLKRKISKKSSIADIACGYGYGTKIVADTLHCIVTGIDCDKETIRNCKSYYQKDKDIRFIIADARQLSSIPDNTFDAIICFETIEHVSKDDGVRVMKEFYRILKPRGCLIISTPNRIWTTLIHLFKRNTYHLHEYWTSEFASLILQSGFSVLHTYGQFIFFPFIYLLPALQKSKDQYIPKLSRSWLYLYQIIIANKVDTVYSQRKPHVNV